MTVKCLNTAHYIMTRSIKRTVRSSHALARNETKLHTIFQRTAFPQQLLRPDLPTVKSGLLTRVTFVSLHVVTRKVSGFRYRMSTFHGSMTVTLTSLTATRHHCMASFWSARNGKCKAASTRFAVTVRAAIYKHVLKGRHKRNLLPASLTKKFKF
jgi:hypothetical protein